VWSIWQPAGAAFNPSTMEAFSTHGNGTMTIVKEKSPASFEVEQNRQTMNGARTVTFDSKTATSSRCRRSVARHRRPHPAAVAEAMAHRYQVRLRF
jgi:DNA-binding beta-propeller fold protein YncE